MLARGQRYCQSVVCTHFIISNISSDTSDFTGTQPGTLVESPVGTKACGKFRVIGSVNILSPRCDITDKAIITVLI